MSSQNKYKLSDEEFLIISHTLYNDKDRLNDLIIFAKKVINIVDSIAMEGYYMSHSADAFFNQLRNVISTVSSDEGQTSIGDYWIDNSLLKSLYNEALEMNVWVSMNDDTFEYKLITIEE